jgi:hypothetical protein
VSANRHDDANNVLDPPPLTWDLPLYCRECGGRFPYPHGVCGACVGRRKLQAARVNTPPAGAPTHGRAGRYTRGEG